jgi:hypothetical protein
MQNRARSLHRPATQDSLEFDFSPADRQKSGKYKARIGQYGKEKYETGVYSAEFKGEIVALIEKGEKPVAQTACSLRLSPISAPTVRRRSLSRCGRLPELPMVI